MQIDPGLDIRIAILIGGQLGIYVLRSNLLQSEPQTTPPTAPLTSHLAASSLSPSLSP